MKQFKKDTLPQDVNYSISYDTIFVNASEISEDTVEIPEEQDTIVDKFLYESETSNTGEPFLLTDNFYYNKLKIITDSIMYTEVEDSIFYEVVPLSLLFETKYFYGFIVDLQYESPEPLNASKKYFLTMNKKGKIISIIEIASRMYGGSATAYDNVRIPWYPEMDGRINTDWTIIKDTDTYGSGKKYKIDTQGKILFIEGVEE